MGGCCSSDDEGPINLNQVDQSHFTMMKVVGKGGFGKVNAVSHRLTGGLMAMKRMKKSKLVSKKMYVVTAWRERDVMAQLKSPFLVNLIYAFQDKGNLFLIMPFMQGGDLRYYLNTKGRMSEDACRFYAAEMILGLQELHGLNIVYRDLKPDNVLLDSTGHLRISDFGLAVILKKENGYKVSGGAGTPGYQAPEVLQRLKYGTSADVWSLGITIYEFLERARPFHRSEDALRDYRVVFHTDVSPEAKSLVRGLLERDPVKRLGCGPEGLEEIKRHKFFAGVDWVKMNNREIKPPHQPELDRANCSADFELQDQFFSEKKEPDLTEEQQLNFKGYEFNVDFSAEMLPLHLQPGAKKGKVKAPPVQVQQPGTKQVIVGEKNHGGQPNVAEGFSFSGKAASGGKSGSNKPMFKEVIAERKEGETGRPKSDTEEDMIEAAPEEDPTRAMLNQHQLLNPAGPSSVPVLPVGQSGKEGQPHPGLGPRELSMQPGAAPGQSSKSPGQSSTASLHQTQTGAGSRHSAERKEHAPAASSSSASNHHHHTGSHHQQRDSQPGTNASTTATSANGATSQTAGSSTNTVTKDGSNNTSNKNANAAVLSASSNSGPAAQQRRGSSPGHSARGGGASANLAVNNNGTGSLNNSHSHSSNTIAPLPSSNSNATDGAAKGSPSGLLPRHLQPTPASQAQVDIQMVPEHPNSVPQNESKEATGGTSQSARS